MDKTSHDVRGRAHRFGAHLPALLLAGGQEYPCTAENFSRTGVLLKGAPALPTERELVLILKSVAGDLQVPIRVRPARRWQDAESGDCFLAVQFAEEDAETRDHIEMLLRRVIEASASAHELPEILPGTPAHEVRKVLEAVPLAHRVGLASRGSPPEREVLRHDPHPQVLESLARNPGLLAHEARALASSLHLSPSTLAHLATDGRWAGDLELKVLVLAHARVPVPVAEKMIAGMPVAALRRVLQKSSLNAAVRTAILRRISQPTES